MDWTSLPGVVSAKPTNHNIIATHSDAWRFTIHFEMTPATGYGKDSLPSSRF